jgi:hypothetical protein
MANLETSALTNATTLDLADIFALVQGGNSREGNFGQVRDLLDGQLNRTLVKPVGTQGRLSLNATMVLLTPDGTSVTATALIPARAIVLCVTSYVVAALTGGPTSFDVGYTGTPAAFGATIGVTTGAQNIGVVAPFPTFAATDVLVTLNGGTGSGNTNKLRLVAYYLGFDTPAA